MLNSQCLSITAKANKPDVKSLAEAAHGAKALNSIFLLTNRCYHLILTAPITSASSKRSFSKLKFNKTVLRSVMKQERLKCLMMLGCKTDITVWINQILKFKTSGDESLIPQIVVH